MDADGEGAAGAGTAGLSSWMRAAGVHAPHAAVRRAHDAVTDLVDEALRLGGTITGEHGVGILKSDWLERELGTAEIERQRGLKAFFDPLGIMNPGRVLWPATPMNAPAPHRPSRDGMTA